MKKCFFALVVLAAFGQAAHAADNPPVKGGMPCFKEVCIGDDITSLKEIKWVVPSITEKNAAAYKATDSDVRMMQPMFKGSDADLKAFAYYWKAKNFNQDAFQRWSRIKTICARFIGNATYLSESGYRTVVYFEPRPSDNGGQTRLAVTMLSRQYPTSWTKDQREEFGKELQGRYPGLDGFTITKPRLLWHPVGTTGGGDPTLQLMGRTDDPAKLNDQLKMQPGCGGADKVKFD